MRQRITFFHRPDGAVDPATLKISDLSLTGPDIPAAREDRITLALEELPSELQKILASTHELHIRWASPKAYESIGPLFSRISPGFHLFYTPQNGVDLKSPTLCNLLQKAFSKDLHCVSPKDSFTPLSSDRFSHSAAFQYYYPLDDLSGFARYVSEQLSSANNDGRLKRLGDADGLDISYDTISHALKVTAIWSHMTRPLLVTTSKAGHRTEVGVLGADFPKTLEPYELAVAGHLTVLGQDKKPSLTTFSFPSRHRHSESTTFSSSFLQPTGLHPTLQLRVSSRKPPVDDPSCSLHAYLTLPRTVFADKYQLGDELFLRSKNLTALRHTTAPVDLEAPAYVMDLWGSAVLLELAPPQRPSSDGGGGDDAPWTAEIPLHLRYLAPRAGGYDTAHVPYPAVFWACAAEEGTKFPTNPFDRVNLGYDGLFGPRTVFWHVDPQPAAGAQLINSVKVPVLDTEKAGWVNVWTAAIIFLGFAWPVWKLVVAYLKTGYVSGGTAPETAQDSSAVKKKKQ